MTLPDPETTEAEPVPIDDGAVIDEIPDDNPFKETVRELHDEGKDWNDIWELLEDAYNPVDQAAYKDGQLEIPQYEVRAVVPDSKATSGERYETFTYADPTEEEVVKRVREKPEVIRVESTEKVGTVVIS